MQELPTSPTAIYEIHRRFCEQLPSELLIVENPSSKENIPIIPGKPRTYDIQVGRHVAISPGAIPRFLERLHEGYRYQGYRYLGQLDSILAVACAHHRLLWIHPFVDGNGRVARMMSYAMLRTSLNTRGLWSVARGLARQESQYKQHLAECDLPRRNDLDGRGTLSEEALVNFTKFFMKVCIDQVIFMENLMDPKKLCDRIMIWAEEQIRANILPPKSDIVLRNLLYQGKLQRGEIATLLGMSERAARRITSALINIGVLTSQSTRMPLHIAFPMRFANRWMPGLFSDIPLFK